jgi:lysophospholipase L1-like esterase
MVGTRLSDEAVHGLRRLSVIVGGLLVGAGVAPELVGVGSAGFGQYQLLLIVLGGIGIVVGWLGRRIVLAHKALALLLLNSLVLLGILELGSGIVVEVLDRRARADAAAEALPGFIEHPYFRSRDWASSFWTEHRQAAFINRYEPYAVWRVAPFAGEYINISSEGERAASSAECQAGSYEILVFGGSAVWGWAAPDRSTIPWLLSDELARRHDRPICVRNLGQNAYVSTQELIGLIRHLQQGPVPDLVIFYDGWNDLNQFVRSGRQGGHAQVDRIAARFEEVDRGPLRELLSTTNAAELIARVTRRRPESAFPTLGVQQEGVPGAVRAIVGTYMTNYAIVEALATGLDFQFVFFWQPSPHQADYEPTDQERAILQRDDPALAAVASVVYEQIEGLSLSHEHLYVIPGRPFNGASDGVWVDRIHLTPEGNQLATRYIAEVLQPMLPRARPASTE